MVDCADVVIVGAGAGGASMAWALTAAGLRVTLIEAGPSYDYRHDYRLHTPDWETGFPLKPGSQGQYRFGEGQTLHPRYDALRSFGAEGWSVPGSRRVFGEYQHVRGVGGSTLHFAGEAHRLHPKAFKMRSRYGVGADWPFDYDELAPYYDRIERFVRVAGPSTARTGVPRTAPFPQPAHPLCHASRLLQARAGALGMCFEQDSLAILSRPLPGRLPCNYCNNCNRGCPRGDKSSADISFITPALASGRLTLIHSAQVLHLQTGDNDRVDAVVYQDAKGRHAMRGRAVVVACGAIETPRLLLVSAQVGSENGIGNETGQVGRHLLETLYLVRGGLSALPLDNWRGVPSDVVCWDFGTADAIAGLIGGFRLALATASGGLNGPRAYATRLIDGWGRQHKQRMREQFGRALYLGALGESLPHPKSQVALSSDRDQHDMPLAQITAWLGAEEIKRLDAMQQKVNTLLAAMEVAHVIEQQSVYDRFSSSHVYGTCRMGTNPEKSVTDPFGRVHRWRNLYVADASLFPSSGGGESPSLTIEALSLRAAGHIVKRLAARDL